MEKHPVKLLDQVRDRIRLKHYSIRTEQAYVSWIKRFILFHKKRHPPDMGEREIEAFNALLFLYNRVLNKRLEDGINPVRAKKP